MNCSDNAPSRVGTKTHRGWSGEPSLKKKKQPVFTKDNELSADSHRLFN